MHTDRREPANLARPEMRAAEAAQCQSCMFWLAGTARCVAFPRGIPGDIAGGRFDHTKSYPGDGDIRFLPRRPHA
jgi:hypothetical protein